MGILSYTNIAKPTGANYTNLSKPRGTDTLKAGMTIGLLIPLTNTKTQVVGDPYVSVSKPTGASYTNIAKPT